jgi:uncharacterized protein (DUF433 family)
MTLESTAHANLDLQYMPESLEMTELTLSETVPFETHADGVIRVSRTRVTLDTLVAAFKDGATAEEIVQQYPSIPLADVYSVIGYYLRHQDATERYLAQRQNIATLVRNEVESRNNPIGIRARLLARRV